MNLQLPSNAASLNNTYTTAAFTASPTMQPHWESPVDHRVAAGRMQMHQQAYPQYREFDQGAMQAPRPPYPTHDGRFGYTRSTSNSPQPSYCHTQSHHHPEMAGYVPTIEPENAMRYYPQDPAFASAHQRTYATVIPALNNPYGYPEQPMQGTAPIQRMELVTSVVEKPYQGALPSQSPQLGMATRGKTPPPEYTRRANAASPVLSSQFSSMSLGSNMSAQRLRPATSTGQPADGYKLVAIPATSSALGSPFLRAYPLALEGYGIPRESFMQFLDHLNRSAVASPPLQVLGLAGSAVSMVPLHTAQIVGNTINLAAKVSTVAVSKGRTEMLMREANATIFAPAGLKAQVAKLDVVAKLANIPILDAEGKIDKQSSLLKPFGEDDSLHSMTAQERRINALSTWLSPLDVQSLPELDSSTNAFGKMHASVSERQRQKEDMKMLKDRKKMHKDYIKDKTKEDREYEEKMEEYAVKERRLREKGGRRMDKDLRELEKKREKLTKEHEKETRKIEKERRKDDKEEEGMRKILFLIIQKI